MRDVERLREKHEFSLDDRQVVALSLCAFLVVGGVFALGLLLGKRISEAPPPPSGDLAALDEAAHKAPPAQVAAVVPIRPNPRAAPPPPPAEEEAAPEQGKPPASLPPEEKPAAPRPPPQRAQADSPHTVVPPPQRAPTVVAAPPRPTQIASAAPVELTPPPKDLGQYAVQVGASQNKLEAQKLEQRVRAAGLKPYVVEADLGAKGVWYRVRVGAFPDKDAANRYRTDVERELRAPAVVMSTR